MSAVLTIQLGQVSQIVIPHEFLMPGADLEHGQGQVLLQDPVSGKPRQHAVVLGNSTAQGRVVTAGLDEGMVLVARIRNEQ
jgi:hypothetical protein